MTAEVFQFISIACFTVGILFAVIAVIYFIRQNVKAMQDVLSGKTEALEVERIREENIELARKHRELSEQNQKRLDNMIRASEQEAHEGNNVSARAYIYKNPYSNKADSTEELSESENSGETAHLRKSGHAKQSIGTTVLSAHPDLANDGTTVLGEKPYDDGTTLLTDDSTFNTNRDFVIKKKQIFATSDVIVRI